MGYEKRLDKYYSLSVPSLRIGQQEAIFEVDRTFFEQFNGSLIEEGDLIVKLDITKYGGHMDVYFNLNGWVMLGCDRCGNPYKHEIHNTYRIIYSFRPNAKFDDHEVIYVDPEEPNLKLAQEIYDYIHVSLPMRKVPEPEVHTCPPEVLKTLGLDESSNSESEEEEVVDPRWAALKKLREEMDS